MDWGDREWAQDDDFEPRIRDDFAGHPGSGPFTARLALLLTAAAIAAIACVAAGQLPRSHPLVPAFAFSLPHIGGRSSGAVDTSAGRSRTEALGGAERRNRPIDVHPARANLVDGRLARSRQGRAARPVGRRRMVRARADSHRRGGKLRRDHQAAPARGPRASPPAARRVRRDEDCPRQLATARAHRSSRRTRSQPAGATRAQRRRRRRPRQTRRALRQCLVDVLVPAAISAGSSSSIPSGLLSRFIRSTEFRFRTSSSVGVSFICSRYYKK